MTTKATEKVGSKRTDRNQDKASSSVQLHKRAKGDGQGNYQVMGRIVQDGESSAAHVVQPLGPNGLIDRVEFIRLIQQQLIELGYGDVSELLQQRSQIEVEKPAVRQFRRLILAGDWEGAIKLLGQLGVFDDDTRREATFNIY